MMGVYNELSKHGVILNVVNEYKLKRGKYILKSLFKIFTFLYFDFSFFLFRSHPPWVCSTFPEMKQVLVSFERHQFNIALFIIQQY